MKVFKMSNRGQTQKKTSIVEVQNIVKTRNHQLLHYEQGRQDPNTIPQNSKIQVRCLFCRHEWRPRLQIYLNRTSLSLGCRKCFEKNIQNPKIFPETPFTQKPNIKNRPKRRAGINNLRRAHAMGQFRLICSREDLIQYLKNEPNKHNDYALELVLIQDQREPKKMTFLKGQFSKHHVLPLHAQGSPDSWNIIYVTKEEHDNLHRLRYQIYQEKGDLKAIFGTSSDLARFQESKARSSQEFGTEELQIGDSATLSNRGKANLEKRNIETLEAIKVGMIWEHRDGYKVEILPNSSLNLTILQIKELLIEALPKNHPDRQRLISNPTSQNFIRAHISTVFAFENSTPLQKSRNSAYGFVVRPYK